MYLQRKKNFKSIILKKALQASLFIGCILITTSCVKTSDYSEYYKDLEFEMPEVHKPSFPAYAVNIADFGGIPDGTTLNTEAFSKAIAQLSKKGGGTLNVTDGIWFTGPIVMKSNINLHLSSGALILFSPDISLYPEVYINDGLVNHTRCQSPISGKGLENIAITGKGSINGSGDAWRPVKRMKLSAGHWRSVIESGGITDGNIWYATDEELDLTKEEISSDPRARHRDYMRPNMVNFTNCKNVLLEGVLFENSPGWNIHPVMCENIILDNVTIRNPHYAQNGDGLDLESCKNAIVVNSTFDVGDDAICIKSGKDEAGRARGIPTENVIVNNCRVYHAHGGFVVGSEMSGGVRNISVKNCQFLGTDIGLRFKSTRGRGGVVENIYIDNIIMNNIIGEPLLFNLFYFVKDKSLREAVYEADETTPEFRNIHIKNITSTGSNKAMVFNGLPEKVIRNVTVENANIRSRYGAEMNCCENITLKNVNIIPEQGEPFIFSNVEGLVRN